MLGVPAPPPYADPSTTGDRILGGVNYASAAAGILDETGQHYVRLLHPPTMLVTCIFRVKIIYKKNIMV